MARTLQAIRSPGTLARADKGPQGARIAPKLRFAIKLRVEEGLTIAEACARAGVSEAGWHKAMKREAVQKCLEDTQALFIREIDRRRDTYKARAIEVAAELMERGQSEAVRMRAVEFFAGETRGGASVNVNIDARSGGYEFVRPGQKLVDVTPNKPKPD